MPPTVLGTPRPNLPLSGIRVVEFAGLAPGPMAGKILADFGADVVLVDRPMSPGQTRSVQDVLARGKRAIAIDMKVPSGRAVLMKLISRADILIDPFRPGVMERLGLGPDIFLGDGGSNSRLVYARLVGFPRTGPYKDMAGHDVNYLALSGVLSMLPGDGKPEFPLNILADFAGGGVMCALGILLALLERHASGRGQVVDCDMVSGTRYIASWPLLQVSLRPGVVLGGPRGGNTLDGGAPFYNVYACADGRWMSVGCIEPRFFRVFLERFLHAIPADFALEGGWRPKPQLQGVKGEWAMMKEFFARGFKMHPRSFWEKIFDGTDACALPVLSLKEAAALAARVSGSKGADPGIPSPAPHPILSSIAQSNEIDADIRPSSLPVPPKSSSDVEEIFDELGMDENEKRELRRSGALDNFVAKL